MRLTLSVAQNPILCAHARSMTERLLQLQDSLLAVALVGKTQPLLPCLPLRVRRRGTWRMPAARMGYRLNLHHRRVELHLLLVRRNHLMLG